MSANVIGHGMEHRRDVYFGLQHAEAAFNVSECLVARDHFGHGEARHVGHEDQFAVHHARTRQRPLVDVVGEQV